MNWDAINTLGELLVISDMDGTLLDSQLSMPVGNMDTIRLLKTLGGHFTVATGRVFYSVEMYPELASVIDPAITCGGCVLYDFQKREASKTSVLQRTVARNAVRDIAGNFPGIGAVVMGNDMRIYQLIPSKTQMKLSQDEKMTYFIRPYEDYPDEWNKVIFTGETDALLAVDAFVSGRTYPGVYFVHTGPNYFEMMPKGVSKASAMHELCALLDISVRNTIVIGDYYNDIDMMKQAGYAVAVSNAPSEVKEVADEVIPSNDEAGVGQFLYGLINRYG